MKKIALLMFAVIVLSTAFMNAYEYYGDYVEKGIEFVFPIVSFFVIIALFAKFRGVSLFSEKELKIMAALYLILTVLKYVYPLYEYSEQTVDASYSTLAVLDFVINLIVARIIIK